MQVAFAAFPDDVKQVESIAKLTDRTDNWKEACDMSYSNKVQDVCQIGEWLL